MVEKEEPPALQPMLSLAAAAQLAYWAATKRENPDGDALNSVARIIAMHVKVFACASGKGCANPALLMLDELHDADFEGGGTTLTFRDGRPPITNVCLHHADLGQAFAEVSAVYRPT